MFSTLKKWLDRLLVNEKIKPLDRFTRDIQWIGNFNAPEAHYEYYFVDMEVGIVGELSGGISPLRDTFYLDAIEVYPKHRRHHYDLSMLANIAQLYDVPITPMPGIDRDFVARMRKLCDGKFKFNAQISEDMEAAERQKWVYSSQDIENKRQHIFKSLIKKIRDL